jgi:hypothetical protein
MCEGRCARDERRMANGEWRVASGEWMRCCGIKKTIDYFELFQN